MTQQKEYKILVVDDESDVLEAIGEIFADGDYAMCYASDVAILNRTNKLQQFERRTING